MVSKNLTERTLIKLTNWQSIMAMAKRDQIIQDMQIMLEICKIKILNSEKNMKRLGKFRNQNSANPVYAARTDPDLGFGCVSGSTVLRLGSGQAASRSRFSASDLGCGSDKPCRLSDWLG